jgi:hypothetical protein
MINLNQKDAVKNLILLKEFASTHYFSSEFALTYEQVTLNMDIFTELYNEDYKELFLKIFGNESQIILNGFKTIMLNSKDIISKLTFLFNQFMDLKFKDFYIKNPNWLIE